jgi:hypothetical protein
MSAHLTMSQSAQLSVRVSARNPDHHLWNNHGTWWCHFTVHDTAATKQRVRRSTGTPQLEEARQIRDFLFAVLAAPATH